MHLSLSHAHTHTHTQFISLRAWEKRVAKLSKRRSCCVILVHILRLFGIAKPTLKDERESLEKVSSLFVSVIGFCKDKDDTYVNYF